MPTSELIARVLIPAVLLIAVLGVPLALWWERHRPSSFTRRPRVMGGVPDNAALDAAERREQGRLRTQSEWRRWDPDAVADAAEAAGSRAVEEAARINVQFHP
jgi:hypothetical protein